MKLARRSISLQCKVRKWKKKYFAENSIITAQIVILCLVNTICNWKFNIDALSMSYCQNKTVMKQLFEGFQQQRVNTLTNTAAIRMGCAGVPLKCLWFCDVRHIFVSPFSHNTSVNRWIYFYMFSEKCRLTIWCNSSCEWFSIWNHRWVIVQA